jgi:hypothetical protein
MELSPATTRSPVVGMMLMLSAAAPRSLQFKVSSRPDFINFQRHDTHNRLQVRQRLVLVDLENADSSILRVPNEQSILPQVDPIRTRECS